MAKQQKQSKPNKIRLFISYSRRDSGKIEKLYEALSGDDELDVFLDQHDIAVAEDWKQRLDGLIRSSDTILFAVSRDSVASDICQWEIDLATDLNKRIIPVIINDVADEDVPEEIARLNYVFARTDKELIPALQSIGDALKIDIDWIREHTRLADMAHRWEQASKLGAQPLRGKELEAAEQWLSNQPKDAPAPTELQRKYIYESRKSATKRQRMTVMGSIAAMLIVGVLAGFAFVQRNAAIEGERKAEAALRSATEVSDVIVRELADELVDAPIPSSEIERILKKARELQDRLRDDFRGSSMLEESQSKAEFSLASMQMSGFRGNLKSALKHLDRAINLSSDKRSEFYEFIKSIFITNVAYSLTLKKAQSDFWRIEQSASSQFVSEERIIRDVDIDNAYSFINNYMKNNEILSHKISEKLLIELARIRYNYKYDFHNRKNHIYDKISFKDLIESIRNYNKLDKYIYIEFYTEYIEGLKTIYSKFYLNEKKEMISYFEASIQKYPKNTFYHMLMYEESKDGISRNLLGSLNFLKSVDKENLYWNRSYVDYLTKYFHHCVEKKNCDLVAEFQIHIDNIFDFNRKFKTKKFSGHREIYNLAVTFDLNKKENIENILDVLKMQYFNSSEGELNPLVSLALFQCDVASDFLNHFPEENDGWIDSFARCNNLVTRVLRNERIAKKPIFLKWAGASNYILGWNSRNDLDVSKAINYFERVVEYEEQYSKVLDVSGTKNQYKALSWISDLYLRTGDFEKAIAQSLKAIDVMQKSPWANRVNAIANFFSNKCIEAKRVVKKLTGQKQVIKVRTRLKSLYADGHKSVCNEYDLIKSIN